MFDKIATTFLASILYLLGFRPYDVIGRFKVDGVPMGEPVAIYTVMLPQNIEVSKKIEIMKKQIPAIDFFEKLFTFDNLQQITMRNYYYTKLTEE